MVELITKPRSPYIRKIGAIKIGANELIQLLEKSFTGSSSEIMLENKNYKLTSLGDIKSNPELLCGHPQINIKLAENSLSLSFSEGAVLQLENTQSDDHVMIFDKFAINLEAYRRPFYFLGSKFISAIFLILMALSLVQIFFTESLEQNTVLGALISKIFFFGSIIGIYLSQNFGFSQIVLRNNKNFWAELHNKSLSSLMIFIGGFILYWAATKLGARP